MSVWKKFGFAWVTLGFLAISLVGHWVFGWLAYVDEQQALGQTVATGGYVIEMLRDTFENWQSEFLQLLWQVVGLAYFLYVGSPSSKENDDRLEAKVDSLLRLQAGVDRGQEIIDELDDRYLRTHGHAKPHAHGMDPVVGAGSEDAA
jgi:uncharacterized protein DUF6766